MRPGLPAALLLAANALCAFDPDAAFVLPSRLDPDAGALEGTVMLDGSPVELALVRLSPTPQLRRGVRWTDGAGAFRFDGLKPAKYELTAAIGWCEATASVTVSVDLAHLPKVSLALRAAPAVMGRAMRSRLGRPI
jgi:hypothetical protein